MKNLVIALILAPAALGYGMATAALHFLAQPAHPAAECGTPGEVALARSLAEGQVLPLGYWVSSVWFEGMSELEF